MDVNVISEPGWRPIEPPAPHPAERPYASDQFLVDGEDEDEDFKRAVEESMKHQIALNDDNNKSSGHDQRVASPPPHSILKKTSSPKRNIPIVPYEVNSLFASQLHYECYSACGFIAILLVHYMVKSLFREKNPVEWWIRVGCWINKVKENEIKRLQTANPNMSRSHVTPTVARELIPTTRIGLKLVEELTCLAHDPNTIKGATPEEEKLLEQDRIFLKDGAFIMIWEAIRRLFFIALDKPASATFVSSTEFIHAIGISWNNDVPESKRVKLRDVYRPNPIDSYKGKEEPFLEELDEVANMEQLFNIDFYDSHLNDPILGMPGDDIRKDSAVWIRFKSLASLRDYFIARYPQQSYDTKLKEKTLFDPRKNSFDLVMWTASDGKHEEPGDINRILNDPYFLNWATDMDRKATKMKQNGHVKFL